MYRASGDLGAGGSPRTGGNNSQTGRPLRCIRVRVPGINRDVGAGNSPVAGRSLVASRRPGAKGDSPRQPACTALCSSAAAFMVTSS